MQASHITERTFKSYYHSTCTECRCPIVPGSMVRYLPKDEMRARMKPQVRHMPGECPAMMDYTVQLMYGATSKRVCVRALSAEEAILKATPKRTARETDRPCGYVVRQGNIEILRRVAE